MIGLWVLVVNRYKVNFWLFLIIDKSKDMNSFEK